MKRKKNVEMVEYLLLQGKAIIFLGRKNSFSPTVFFDKAHPSPAPLPEHPNSTNPSRCMNVFRSQSTGFKDGRKDELFPPLAALSSSTETGEGLCCWLKIKQWGGGCFGNRGRAGIFPSGITRLLVAGPDGTTVCLWRQSFPLNWLCKQEYEVWGNVMAKR